MDITFTKTIQGHQLEFSKFCYSNCYHISPKHDENTGVILSMRKDHKGFWTANTSGPLPAWFNEISIHVHYAIEAHETKEIKTEAFQHYGFLF